MKKYTDSVRRGLRLIDGNMRIYAMDKRDEKDPEGKDVDAALDWIAAQEQRAKRAVLASKPKQTETMQTKIISYGAGTNSTAMLVGLHERGERPDLILFADTGGERPETYQHRDTVSDWCESVGFPRIVTVAEAIDLETDCLTRGALPGIAYGFKSCSDHYKIRPQKRWLKAQGITDTWFWVGIDAGEAHRAKYAETRYPLIEWDWGREECVEAIARAGLPQPGKSACFFCPSSKPQEILQLGRTHPDLLERALAMEANAELTSVKGLGRHFAWGDLVRFSEAQIDMFQHTPEIPCGCFDG